MVYTGQLSTRQRAFSGGGALLAAMVAGFMLIDGFTLVRPRYVDDPITVLELPAPSPAAPAATAPSETPAGTASAANRTASPTPIAAPKPVLPPVDPPPVIVATTAGSGSEASAGAAPVAGPGSGAGGRGTGLGAGGSGRGTGGATRPLWRSGTIDDRDYPRAARRAGIGGEVEVRFTIEASGRVTGCRVARSSGEASLDSATCRLIEERFRFKPATDAAGRPVASGYGWRQRWWLERR